MRILLTISILAAFAMVGTACRETGAQDAAVQDMTMPELIVLAAPGSQDTYYAGIAEDIVAFHIAYARQIIDAGDDVIILADPGRAPRYRDALGDDHVLELGQEDVWMRDFALSVPESPILFRYTAAGQGGGTQGQRDADHVQTGLRNLLGSAGLNYVDTDLLNDGGNIVGDYAGRAVISRKFLRDNALSEAEARLELGKLTALKQIAFVEADDPGGLEHADGMVAFLEPNVLVINAYEDDPAFTARLIRDLETAFPEAKIHPIVMPFDERRVYDAKFGSACGIYTNMLVTPERIYLPQFGIPEDAEALATVRSLTDKAVIPVQSGKVCTMGGGVRCMSWQLRGINAARLREFAEG